MAKILLVDDDPQALGSTRKILELSGHGVKTATDGQSALDLIRPSGEGYDLVITDVRMPKLGGLEFLKALSVCADAIPVVLMTAYGQVEDAVWAMKLGAVDFLTKPFKRQALLLSIESALKRSRNKNFAKGKTVQLIGGSAPMMELRESITQVAPTAATVLLTGESGTGKELVARCIHEGSSRSRNGFVALNCAAVPEQLIESELFGFEKGAFTGATAAKVGLFEAADGGTLLLDEIGDMPIPLQAKLLRTLQDSEIRRLGSTTPRKVDVRVIAATHRNLREAVRTGLFRQDLLYRLEVVSLWVPSLRERKDDLPELVRHFIRTASERHGRQTEGISDEAMSILLSHDWPGNVRELSNVVERAVIFANDPTISPSHLPSHLVPESPENRSAPKSNIVVPLGTPLREVEDLMIRKTLEATEGDKNMTAKILGINSRTIYRKLDKRSQKETD